MARRTGYCTSTPPTVGVASAISPRVCGARAAASGGVWSRLFRLRLELHEGRGEILTVTGAQTVDGHARLRADARALDAAARACDAVGRLFETPEPHPGVFHLLCRRLSLLDAGAAGAPAQAAEGVLADGSPEGALAGRSPEGAVAGRSPDGALAERSPAGRAAALQFRLKLLHAAGLAPQLGSCAGCGEREHLVGFSGAAGGVVCGACEAGSFPLGEEAHDFMVGALGRALADTPEVPGRALGQVERALSETLEHHAHVRLMPAVARGR